MIARLALLSILLFLYNGPVNAQARKIPRDLDRLISRAQEFWAALGSNQRLKALSFVLPEKQEFLLSTGGMPFTEPQVIGVDFANDANRAVIRVSVNGISREAPSGRMNWIVTETWVFVRNNWFLDIQDPLTGVNPFVPTRKNVAPPDALIAEAESRFKILTTSIDVGTLPQGSFRRIPVLIEYTGDVPLTITSNLPSDLVSLDGLSSQRITAQSKEFSFLLNTEGWDGPFALPYALKVHYKGVTLDRTVTIKGNVFAPLSVVQKPAPFTNVSGQELALTIRNNTGELLAVGSVGTAGAFDVVRVSENIPAGGSGELVLRLAPNAQADVNHRIRLNLKTPFLGRDDYYLTLRVRAAP